MTDDGIAGYVKTGMVDTDLKVRQSLNNAPKHGLNILTEVLNASEAERNTNDSRTKT